ncbi:uncharacterized protein N7469_006992 [Penicillium citrinum]|uniref:Uncharacterized protein n=1 Tax=Penicillium citrinum TaxID=5077 RepID=A0A9W9TL99_PENCI|nr:uncharacterized protein N7469_006992 [Penicillium citrinum]KAJ5226986.1 hypothetical protein N7469_006992 [Penicillium citrinum]
MAPTKLPLHADEELGKKDDDHRYAAAGRFKPFQHSAIHRPRRIFFLIVFFVLVYQFFKHMPTDLTPAVERYNPTIANPRPPNVETARAPPQLTVPDQAHDALKQSPEQPDSQLHGNQQSYDGKIRFQDLAQSLPSQKHPKNQASNAVVFAGSDLHCISSLIPLACRMASQRLNQVHLVLLGKDEVSIEGIKQVNGVKDSECSMIWHDGRPDHAAQSTHARMERAVVGGLRFIQDFIAPEVIITQNQYLEDPFFWNGLSVHKYESGVSHIMLPTVSENLMWIALLQSNALKAWNEIQIDMVIHATQSSGALLRLIHSLDAADYLGAIPRLTIELPALVESQLLESLQSLKLKQLQSHITLRRRLEPRYMDAADSSLRTVESFYPLNPSTTHLLLLSPQAELAPSFFHYLKYNVLRYKQSPGPDSTSLGLLGISLELPTSKPSVENSPFTPPSTSPLHDGKDQNTWKKEHIPSLLWQSPNSNAALYFGDKWVEFHSFLSSHLVFEGRANSASKEKQISKKYPAFMEFLLEMMQERNYFMIYPSFSRHAAISMATVHTEMHHLPEEFINEKSHQDTDGDDWDLRSSGSSESETFYEMPVGRDHSLTPLLDTFELGLADIGDLPILSFEGRTMSTEELAARTKSSFESS